MDDISTDAGLRFFNERKEARNAGSSVPRTCSDTSRHFALRVLERNEGAVAYRDVVKLLVNDIDRSARNFVDEFNANR